MGYPHDLYVTLRGMMKLIFLKKKKQKKVFHARFFDQMSRHMLHECMHTMYELK